MSARRETRERLGLAAILSLDPEPRPSRASPQVRERHLAVDREQVIAMNGRATGEEGGDVE